MRCVKSHHRSDLIFGKISQFFSFFSGQDKAGYWMLDSRCRLRVAREEDGLIFWAHSSMLKAQSLLMKPASGSRFKAYIYKRAELRLSEFSEDCQAFVAVKTGNSYKQLFYAKHICEKIERVVIGYAESLGDFR